MYYYCNGDTWFEQNGKEQILNFLVTHAPLTGEDIIVFYMIALVKTKSHTTILAKGDSR